MTDPLSGVQSIIADAKRSVRAVLASKSPHTRQFGKAHRSAQRNSRVNLPFPTDIDSRRAQIQQGLRSRAFLRRFAVQCLCPTRVHFC